MKSAFIAVVTLAILPTTSSAEIVARYHFEEGVADTIASGTNSVIDSSGNNLNGTPFGEPIYREIGGSLGLEFDGTNDRVFIPDAPQFELTESMTVAATIRLDAFNAVESQIIVFRGDDRGGLDPFQLVIRPDGRLRFVIHAGPGIGAAYTESDAPIAVNQLMSVAGTLDHITGQLGVFIDGQLVGSETTLRRPLGPLDPALNPGIGIGSRQTGGGNHFAGFIDNVMISNSVIAVPEPSCFLLLGVAAIGLATGRRPRR